MDKLTQPIGKGEALSLSYQSGQGLSLNDLSNEIITLIAQNVREPFDNLFNYNRSYHSCNNTLLNFALCSRRLRTLVEPFLYEEFNEFEGPRTKPQHRDIVGFVCRLLARPDLAAKVKRVSVQGQPAERGPSGEPLSDLVVSVIKDEEWTRIEDAIKDLTDDEQTKPNSLWEIRDGRWEAFFVVMLSILPSLREVVAFNWGHYYDNYILLDDFLGQAALQQKTHPSTSTTRFALQCLEEVTLIYHDTEGCMSPQIMFPWMALPSVHTIKASAISANSEDDEDEDFDVDDTSEFPDWASRDKFPNMRRLTLENSSLNAIDIAGVLRPLTNIESLEYWHGGATVSYGEFHATRMIHGISVAKRTLKHLHLFDMDCSGEESILEETNGVSLKDFTSLKTLHTYPAALLGSIDTDPVALLSNLPVCIESLIIDEGNHDLMSAAITHLLENIASFPALKSINLGWRLVIYPDGSPPRLADNILGFERSHALHLIDLCKEAGIEMVLKESKPPYKLFYDWYDKSENPSIVGGRPEYRFMTQYVEYPYAKWDEMCKEFDVNPDTGRRWDSRYPMQGVVWHYAP